MAFTTLDLSKQSGTSLPSSIVTASGLSTGKIGQVVGNNSVSKYSTNSTSFTSVYSAPSITPSATSSKILVLGSVNYNVYGNGSTSYPNGYFALNQEISGGTDTQITENQTSFSGNVSTDNTDQQNSGIFLSKLFSPNTTSQVDCKIRMKATAGRIGILGQSSTPNYSLINVLEIGA